MPTQPPVTNRDLEIRLERLEECAEESSRALKGHNGDVGLVGRVLNLETQLTRLMNNDLPHIREEILRELQSFKDLYAKDQAAESEKNVQWPKIAEKFVFPVVLAIITAVTVAWVMKSLGP